MNDPVRLGTARALLVLLFAAGICAFSVAPAGAADGDQRPGAPPPPRREPGRAHSLEITVGGEWLGAESLGTAPATMLQNSAGSGSYTYFAAAGTRAAAPAFRGGVGYTIIPAITVEGSLLASRGDVNASISSDAEGVAATVASERLTQYFFDASVLFNLRHLTFSQGAGLPFLEAGAGYLRQLHEGNIAVDTGQIYHFGGGIKYVISARPRGRLTGVGIRADARVYLRNKGFSFDNGHRAFASLGGGLYLTF